MDSYQKFSLQKVINASGKMTILGVSTVSDEVMEAMNEGATHFFVMKELLNQTGNYIAKLLQVEAAYIVSSASSGIAQSVASLIVKDDLVKALQIHRIKDSLPREIIIAKGHNVNYGVPVETMIELGGGKVVEAGYANECKKEHIEGLITNQTVGLLYIKSHHCVQKGIAGMKEYVELSKKYNIPLIIDAAAEEDLTRYYQMGGDIVIYSGAKAIEGPTSGLVLGKENYIENIKLQSNAIGRAMKIGKENILGLVKAIENYALRSDDLIRVMIDKVDTLNAMFIDHSLVSATKIQDEAGREIYRSELCFDKSIDVVKLSKKLKEGEIAIYTRDYRANKGKIEIDVRSVTYEQLNQIYQKINQLLQNKEKSK